jgi:hypothetical protein
MQLTAWPLVEVALLLIGLTKNSKPGDNPIPTRFLAPHRLFKNSSTVLAKFNTWSKANVQNYL